MAASPASRCGLLGLAVGLLAVPPTVRRSPTAFVVIVVYAILAVPIYQLAPALAPAAWLAAAVNDSPAHHVDATVEQATVVALVHAALVVAGGEALRRRMGGHAPDSA